MAYMDRYLQAKGLPNVAAAPHNWLPEGIGVGVLGGVAVAAWFLVLDLLTRSAFYTPAALGSVVFYGAQGPEEVQKSFNTIGGYTLIHFAVFMALGALFAWMVARVESGPHRWLISLLALIVMDGLFAGTVMMVGEWVISSVGVWAIAVGNLVALVVMAGTMWATHPRLRRELHDHRAEPAV